MRWLHCQWEAAPQHILKCLLVEIMQTWEIPEVTESGFFLRSDLWLIISHFRRCMDGTVTTIPPPKFICWSPTPQGDGIWRWSLWEVSRFRWGQEVRLPDGIAALKRRDSRGLVLSLSLHPWALGWKVATCKPGRGFSPEPGHAWHPDLWLPASRTIRNKDLLFKPPGLWGFVIAAQAD